MVPAEEKLGRVGNVSAAVLKVVLQNLSKTNEKRQTSFDLSFILLKNGKKTFFSNVIEVQLTKLYKFKMYDMVM